MKTGEVLISCAVLFFFFLFASSFQQTEAVRQSSRYEDKSMFQMARAWTREQPVKARHLAEKMTTVVKDENDRRAFLEAFDDVIVQPLEDSAGCTLCELLMGLFKAALRQNNYTDIEDELIYYCEFLLVAIDQRIQAKEICAGVISLQAPHVARIVTSRPVPSNRELCEFLNTCFPSTTPLIRPKIAASSDAQPLNQRNPNRTKGKRIRKNPIAPAALNGTITIVQLTDIHLEKDYGTESLTECWMPVCCQLKYGTGDAGHYGDYSCNIPLRTMELFFQKVAEIAPDFIIYSGDSPPHTMWDESLESQLNCTVTLTNTLGRILGNTRVYPCIGNHEMFPTNLFSASLLPNETKVMLKEFARLWTPLAAFSAEEIQTMEESGYYTKLIGIANLRVVAMNTLYLYTFNFYNVLNHNDEHSGGEVTRLQESIVDILTQARDSNEKVIFVGHHVPGNGDFIVKVSHWYKELMVNFSDVIVLHVSGHTHTDEYRLFFNDDGTAASMVYVSPSVDAHGYKNPSMRVFYLDPTTYEVLDYEQYYFDIKQVQPGPTVTPPTIVRLYSAKEEYGLTDLSPNSWLALLDRFRSDPALLQRHRSHSDANAHEDASYYDCTGKCVDDYICRLSSASYDDYVTCTTPVQETSTRSSITWPIITEYQTTTTPVAPVLALLNSAAGDVLRANLLLLQAFAVSITLLLSWFTHQ